MAEFEEDDYVTVPDLPNLESALLRATMLLLLLGVTQDREVAPLVRGVWRLTRIFRRSSSWMLDSELSCWDDQLIISGRMHFFYLLLSICSVVSFTDNSLTSFFCIPFEIFIMFRRLLAISVSRLRFFSSKTSLPFFIFSSFPFILRVWADILVYVTRSRKRWYLASKELNHKLPVKFEVSSLYRLIN